ncbi:hypothetical protein DOTSEDRAFT_35769 [Dothistroma septosporum NZE10]|uniref:Uncharacterized protein n=1 Tax=Dothistroma septosporum (strain NZE10 / CBS 128990) TaxID=675120 RepID=M2YPH7_DOTSN|nr:hypothetical protein DOTSEDRAFT_35769 [Dothistroma septosporum NZE10]
MHYGQGHQLHDPPKVARQPANIPQLRDQPPQILASRQRQPANNAASWTPRSSTPERNAAQVGGTWFGAATGWRRGPSLGTGTAAALSADLAANPARAPAPVSARPAPSREQAGDSAPRPAHNQPSRAALPAAPAANAGAEANRTPFATYKDRNVPQQQIGQINAAVTINAIGQNRLQGQNGPFIMAPDIFGANMDNPQMPPQGLNFPINLPGSRSCAWLDDDAEAKELYQKAARFRKHKRDQYDLGQNWVKNCQGFFHEKAAKEWTAPAKEMMRKAPASMRKWERYWNATGKTRTDLYHSGANVCGLLKISPVAYRL